MCPLPGNIACDLQDFESVRKAAAEIKSQYSKIYCLANNAGIMATPDRATKVAGLQSKLLYIYIYMFVTYHDILLRIINIHLNTFYDMLQHITVLYIIISHFNILWRIIALYIYNNVKHNINVIRHTTTLLISKATTLYT